MNTHRLYLLASLAVSALAGTGLGLWLVLGWLGWLPLTHHGLLLSAHSQLQVYGFVVLFTMGVALMMFPRILGIGLQPPGAAGLALTLMLAGTAANLAGPVWPGAALQTAAVLTFIVCLRSTRKLAPKREKLPLDKSHAVFLGSGSFWLLVSPALSLWDATRALETVLWGFAGLYIAGIGLRVHTGILGLKGGLANGYLLPAAVFWNLALLLRWTGPAGAGWWCWSLVAGVAFFLLALKPFRASFLPPAGGAWLRYFVRTSYAWLMLAAGLFFLTDHGYEHLAGAARHALATGFILTMMMGMGFRMIPAFEVRQLVWSSAPWVTYVLISLGTVLRVSAQAAGEIAVMALGASLQTLAVLVFAVALGFRSQRPLVVG